MFALKFTTSNILGDDMLREVLTTGSTLSLTEINVEFCLTLLLVSVTYIVKLRTAGAEGSIVTLLT